MWSTGYGCNTFYPVQLGFRSLDNISFNLEVEKPHHELSKFTDDVEKIVKIVENDDSITEEAD